MITEEQIKNLKPGDALLIECTFNSVYDDGDICINAKELDIFSDEVITNTKYVHPSCVSLPSAPSPTMEIFKMTEVPQTYPKYDPSRKFRERDKVRFRKVNERFTPEWHAPTFVGSLGIIVSDERESGYVRVHCYDGICRSIDATYLELVTPVEELEPYYIETETFDYEIRNANDDPDIGTSLALHIKIQDPDEGQILRVKSYYESYVYSREHAIADAEAERDRLNAEWRKEQSDD